MAWLVFASLLTVATSAPAAADHRDPRADAALARELAIRAVINDIDPPQFALYPNAQRQTVYLDTFLHIERNWDRKSATRVVGDQAVTVTATPTISIWEFRERATGASSTVRCNNRGEPWTPGDRDPLCPKPWEHTSHVTGNVELTVSVRYVLSWFHPLTSGTRRHTERSPLEPELVVGEVQARELDPGSASDFADPLPPESYAPLEFDCAAAGAGGAGVSDLASALGVDCTQIQLIWEISTGFLSGCGDELIAQIGELWETFKNLGDPGEVLKQGIAALRELYASLVADPIGAAAELGYELLNLDPDEIADWGPEDWAEWAGGFVCGLAFDYLTGKAAAKLFDFVKKKTSKDRDDEDRDDEDRDDDQVLCPRSSNPNEADKQRGCVVAEVALDILKTGDEAHGGELDWEQVKALLRVVKVLGLKAVCTAVPDELLPSAEDHYARNTENDRFFRAKGLYRKSDLTVQQIKDAGMKQASASETQLHRIGEGNEDNLKFTSTLVGGESVLERELLNRYGRYEIVVRPNRDEHGDFTGTYTHVTDPVNMGTLNRGNNFGTHLIRDICPYLKYGNTPDTQPHDPTEAG